MPFAGGPEPDLMPPAFAEGLDDWSRGDGTPDSPTYEHAEHVRLARGDGDFGTCLEMRLVEPVQRLRYMGEVPVRSAGYLEISVRVKALRGGSPSVRVAAWPGGVHGRGVPGLPEAGPEMPLAPEGVVRVSAVIGSEARPGVDLVWDGRVLYAHVGLDVIGPPGAVIRIESLEVRDVTRRFRAHDQPLPGFGPEPADAR